MTGIKPTYGRCSRYGIIAFASSLDQAGPIAKDVRDAAIMLTAMSGYDAKDSTSADVAVPDFESFLGQDVRGLKIGIPAEYRPDGLNAEIAAYWDKGIEMLKVRGAEIVDISLPHTKYALAAYYIIAPAEASSNLNSVILSTIIVGALSSLMSIFPLKETTASTTRKLRICS